MPTKILGNPIVQALELICGKPSLFTVQEQALNWLTFFSSTISLLVGIIDILLKIPAFWALMGFAVCLAAYVAVRFFHYISTWLMLLPFSIYFVGISAAWFISDGIHGSAPLYAVLPIFAIVVVLRGWLRIFMLVGVIAHIYLLVSIQSWYPAWVMPYPDLTTLEFDRLAAAYFVAIFALGYTSVLLHNLSERRRQTDLLLSNILPTSIAHTLTAKPTHNIAHYFENVSILFADVVNFTPMSATMTPVELVSLLNELFSDFDALVALYDVEKIKTIGDCYMIAAGAPATAANHAHLLTQIALCMQQIVRQKEYQGRSLTLRIGINSGSVVAGVIGKNKFIYDLWGDAVNTASRMESHSTSGSIQITRATYELIHESFTCIPQGAIPIKGKGPLEVWHVANAISC